MRIFDKEHKLVKIVCNHCGAQLDVAGGLEKGDFLSVSKEWGYFSHKDTQLHQFDLCEACYDGLIAGFTIPVEIENKKEIL